MGSESVAAALRKGAKDIVWAAARASLPNMAVVMAPINKGALRPPTRWAILSFLLPVVVDTERGLCSRDA